MNKHTITTKPNPINHTPNPIPATQENRCRKHSAQKLRGQERCDAKFWVRFAASEMPTDSKSTFWFFFVLKKEQYRHTTPNPKH